SQEGYEPDGAFTPKAGTARFDSGAMPAVVLAGFEAALACAPQWRFERARQTAERCRELLAARCEVVTSPGQATLVPFRPGGEAAGADVASRLLGLPPGQARLRPRFVATRRPKKTCHNVTSFRDQEAIASEPQTAQVAETRERC